ncbi:MAG: HAD family phosphatase [Burkholderiaceae bacterium]|nr:HAD family phosphatase [Burkholderiaceae bacterium]
MRLTATWPSAVLFDCDGVLIDNETPTRDILHVWAVSRLKLPAGMADDFAARCRGIPTARFTIWPEIAAAQVTEIELAELDACVERMVLAHARPMDGLVQAIDSLSCIKAVVSNSSLRWIRHVLALIQLEHAFGQNLFSANGLPSKPDPAVYRHAVATLKLPPSCCIAIEDSPAGVCAARQARIPTIGFVSSQQDADTGRALLAAGAADIAVGMSMLPFKIKQVMADNS